MTLRTGQAFGPFGFGYFGLSNRYPYQIIHYFGSKSLTVSDNFRIIFVTIQALHTRVEVHVAISVVISRSGRQYRVGISFLAARPA